MRSPETPRSVTPHASPGYPIARAHIPGVPRPGEPGWPSRPSTPSIPGIPLTPGGPDHPSAPTSDPGPVPPTRVWLDPHADWQGKLYERLLAKRIVLASGLLDDDAASRLSAQLLTLDAEQEDPIRLELQNLRSELPATLTVMGILDVLRVPVHACVSGEISGPALGVLASCPHRSGLPERQLRARRAQAAFRRHGDRGHRARAADDPHARHAVLQAGRRDRPRGGRDPRRRAPRPDPDHRSGHWIRSDPGTGNQAPPAGSR